MPKGQFTGTPEEVLEKLLDHTVWIESTQCMIWKGGKSRYPFCSAFGKQWNTHRLVLYLITGHLPEKYDYDTVAQHSCDNTLCINPNHLSWSTQKLNIHDAISKGRYNQKGENNPGAKLTPEQVKAIRSFFKKGNTYGLTTNLAKLFNVHRTTIQRIRLESKWKE